MAPGERKRPHRIPLTPEEVAQLVSLKKLKEARKLARFKKSSSYKALNVFNICCFFVYWEILFCFMGPCHYQTHYARSYAVRHGDEKNEMGKKIISQIDINGVDGKKHRIYVRDFIETPQKFSSYQIGKDYLLQKELKAILVTSEASYGLQSASSIIFLSVFTIVISCISFFYNLHENSHSLTAVTVMNALTILAFTSI